MAIPQQNEPKTAPNPAKPAQNSAKPAQSGGLVFSANSTMGGGVNTGKAFAAQTNAEPKLEKLFEGVYRIDGRLASKSAKPGVAVYGEKLVTLADAKGEKAEHRSKIAAALVKGLAHFAIKPGSKVLYLGAANGTTISHVSDIIGPDGLAFGVEFSARSMRDLLKLCESRSNILPILADARQPHLYAEDVGGPGSVDVVFEDVADRDQASILIDNAAAMLKPGGVAYIAIKSRSIDARMPPHKIFAQVEKELEPHFKLMQGLSLEPFEADHAFLSLVRK
jgi:fibrillarin-like pre-rRNA processing protein